MNMERANKQLEEWLSTNDQAKRLAGRWLEAVPEDGKVNVKMLEKRHWLEAMDSHHRHGRNLEVYFNEWHRKKNGSPPFFEWLDEGDVKVDLMKKCPRHELDGATVCYLEPEEREKYEVIAENGRLVYKTNLDAVDTETIKWIYVLSPSRQLFVGQKEKGSFHHSSFLAGAPVLAAGFTEVSQGTVKDLTWNSGHYKPTEKNFEQLIRFLEEKQVDLRNIPKVGQDAI